MSTRSVTDRETFFVESLEARNARCIAKDAVVFNILRSISIRNPLKFTAVLMPSMYGPEIAKLKARGVPVQNMFAIERDPHVHGVLCRRAAQHDDPGPATTKRPLPVQAAVDYIPFETVNLIYLDFFCQPDGSHLQTLIKIFRLGLVKRGTRLLTTFGANRGDTFSCQLNAQIRCGSVGQAYIEAALKRAGHRPYRQLVNYPYLTEVHTANFVTTEVVF